MIIHSINRPYYITRYKILKQKDSDYHEKVETLMNRLKYDLFKDVNGKLYKAEILKTKDLSKYDEDYDSATTTIIEGSIKIWWKYVKI
jgi:hypothetical protein